MYKMFYRILRRSKAANFMLHRLFEGSLLNRISLYQAIYRKVINIRAERWIKKPPFLEITVTDICNSACSMCPPAVHSGNSIMSNDLFFDIVLQARELGIRKLILTGGEPLLDPAISEKIAFAKSNLFLHVHMFTNGSLLTKNLATDLMKAGLDSLTISIDSFDRKEFETIRVGLSFEKVMEAVRNFRNWRTEAGFSLPLLRLNRLNLPENSSSVNHFRTNAGQYADIVELIDAHNFADPTLNQNLAGKLYHNATRYPCNLLFQKISISPKGFYRKCSIDYSECSYFASAKDVMISDILDTRFYDLKRKFLREDYSEPGCLNCTHNQSWWIDWEIV